MAPYKTKTKQYVINSAKQPIYVHRDEYILFNLNACFVKKNNYVRFQSMINEAVEKGGTKLNLGNLASLCYKIEMDYNSEETYEFVQRIIEIIKGETDIELTQDNILSYGETDMRPLDSLVSYDGKSNILYTNSVLIDCLKILGYGEAQVHSIIDFTKDLSKIIPCDLIEELPISNKFTRKSYDKIKGLINDSRICYI